MKDWVWSGCQGPAWWMIQLDLASVPGRGWLGQEESHAGGGMEEVAWQGGRRAVRDRAQPEARLGSSVCLGARQGCPGGVLGAWFMNLEKGLHAKWGDCGSWLAAHKETGVGMGVLGRGSCMLAGVRPFLARSGPVAHGSTDQHSVQVASLSSGGKFLGQPGLRCLQSPLHYHG
jgi:hypothetical protein